VSPPVGPAPIVAPAPPPAAASTGAGTDGARSLARLAASATRSALLRPSRGRLRSSRSLKLDLRGSVGDRVTVKVTLRRGGRTITVATAKATFRAAGVRKVTLRFTRAGRQALRRRGSVPLRGVASVTPKTGRTASARTSLRV